MSSEIGDYRIAWILPSFDQHTLAQSNLDNIVNCFSSLLHITYTFGKVGEHFVVIASPAANTTFDNTENIINDLSSYVSSIRAGFLVSSDATVPRTGDARIGDVIVGGTLPHIEQGVIYIDAEKTARQRRLFITGESQNIPSAVAEAVRRIRTPKGRQDWLKYLGKDITPTEPRLDLKKKGDGTGGPDFPTPRALLGVIATSTQRIEEADLVERIAPEKKILCFETVTATMKSRPFLVVAGVANYCGDHPDKRGPPTSKAVISYLTCLVRYLDYHRLDLEPSIMDPFEYKSFDLDQQAFRLLKLQKGAGTEQIQCDIFQAYFDEINLVPYEALSYCWGSNRLTNRIRVNGKAFSITSNLFKALQFLRLSDADRILWIDAICIDQGNNRERGHQVEQMGDVYKRADRVLFWLGDVGTYEVYKLISALKRFEEIVPVDAWERWAPSDLRFRTIWESVQEYSTTPQSLQRRMFELLTENEWFKRIWIIQEVFNATRASLGCSEGWINSRTFALAPRLLQIKPNTQCQAVIDIMPGPSRASSWCSQHPNLSTLLWKFRDSNATDPRDRAFALLGIASDEPFKSDYSKTERAVVDEIMMYLSEDQRYSESSQYPRLVDLQTRLPYLSWNGLDKLIFKGTRLSSLRRFSQKHTNQMFLSEAAVNYLWYIESPLRNHFLDRSSLVQIVPQDASVLHEADQTVCLAAFLESNKRMKITQTTLQTARAKGHDFVSLVIQRDRDDMEINEDLAKEAFRLGPNILDRLVVKYGAQATITDDFITVVISCGEATLERLFRQCGKSFKITPKIALQIVEEGPSFAKLLIEDFHDQIPFLTEDITCAAIRQGEPIFRLLLQKFDGKVKCTERVKSQALSAGTATFRLLLEGFAHRDGLPSFARLAASLWRGVSPAELVLYIFGASEQVLTHIQSLSELETVDMLRDRYGDRYDIREALHQAEDRMEFANDFVNNRMPPGFLGCLESQRPSGHFPELTLPPDK